MRVLLADHHTEVRWALRTAIKEVPDLMLVGEAIQAKDLLSQARALRPDLILLEWELPGRSARNLLAALREIDPLARVIVLSREPESQEPALDAGADVFVSKANGPEELLAALHRLAGW
jgi:DNA-binding NarL/FixJ family response regulator